MLIHTSSSYSTTALLVWPWLPYANTYTVTNFSVPFYVDLMFSLRPSVYPVLYTFTSGKTNYKDYS